MHIKCMNLYITAGAVIIIFPNISASWAHYEKSFRGSCHPTGKCRSSCKDLGEHAYKGMLLDEPPKGPRFYTEDLEPFSEEYPSYDRQKRASKKESKNIQNESAGHKEYYEEDEDDEDDEEMEEEKSEKPVKKSNDKKKNKKKKLEENLENGSDEDEDSDDADDEERNDNENNDAESNDDEEEKGSDKHT